MERFSRWALQQDGEETVVVLYIDQPSAEFGEEFFHRTREKVGGLQERVKHFVAEKYPHLQRATVKVMAGSTMVAMLSQVQLSKASAHETNFNMSYQYFGKANTYLSQIERTKGNVNTSSPSYFDINIDGSLKLTPSVDPSFVSEMHNRGGRVVPFLSNHWDRELGRAALANREQLSIQIVEAVETYNLDGVNVDIENVTEADRDNFTDLVRLLREKLPADKEVSVAVAANPNGWKTGWHGSYNYVALSKYSDYLMIMAYDESYPGGPEGPVASLPWVKRSIEYAIAQGVPSEKIVLGLPFFGRYWQEGKSTGGNGISANRVAQMIERYESTIVYDEAAQSPKAIVKIKDSDEPFRFASVSLGPGTYHIWYEDERSIAAKVNLVHEYHLKGTGSWSLGQENTMIWDNFGVWLKGHVVAQVPVKEVKIEPSATTTLYTVVSGDTLSGIAYRFHTTVESIKGLNNLTSDTIFVGQKLNVPTLHKVQEAVVKTGWKFEGDKRYYYGSNGVLKTSWLKDGDSWYFFDTVSGEMRSGWIKDDDSWYYLSSSGEMQTGWIKDQNKWYFLSDNGAMQTGWIKHNNRWYHLSSSGAMSTGWIKDQNKWYYMNPTNGDMRIGWLKYNNNWYYLGGNGVMVTGQVKIGGKWYKFDRNGVWIG
ncbi:LysM peptidoglycan-binding domain-containing protein [Bacillus timonensis]|nr:LysM peptidoglycan-binding domain-containing protein [Bacillus timonensis]